MIAVAVTVFEIDAIGNTVSGVIGCGSSTLVTPNPRRCVAPFFATPSATPGTLYSAIFCVTSAAICSNAASACAKATADKPPTRCSGSTAATSAAVTAASRKGVRIRAIIAPIRPGSV